MTDLARFFQLRVEHTYFRNKKNLNIGFMPVGLSPLLISKYILYLLERPDGFELLIDMNRFDMLTEYIREEEQDHLGFIMFLDNRDFLNYTELDIPKGSFLFLQGQYPADNSKENIILHKGEFVSEQDLADLSSADAAIIPKEITLKPNSFALIHLPFRRQETDLALINENGKLISSAGTIKFKARSTFRKYLIYTREDSQFDSIQVTDSRGQVTFSEMHAEEDPDGRQVFITESNSKIPLQGMSDYQFQLKGIQNGIEQILIPRLAEPNPDYLSRDNGKLFSTIFIYY